MGTPTYRSTSYDGKGSSSVPSSRVTGTKSKSAMLEMLELLQEVEKCRDGRTWQRRARRKIMLFCYKLNYKKYFFL